MRIICLSGLLALSLACLGGCSSGTTPANSPDEGSGPVTDGSSDGGGDDGAGDGDGASPTNACDGLTQKKCSITMGCAWSPGAPAEVEDSAEPAEEGEAAAEPAEPAMSEGKCVPEKAGGMM